MTRQAAIRMHPISSCPRRHFYSLQFSRDESEKAVTVSVICATGRRWSAGADSAKF